ncbi:TetR/AcrR family transcriptional regulator [Hoyosella altamirensis]|uniref:AcrR family transcriptional regulator n=1 Tax=Hoyosella altamirensis TaxID=616997 RepID=A0A839RIM9_9ACTN|nr:TetR/AcrR family transcriptional regulator [Hoyosella altamirensis]MBB3036672.1 AcrR family transcriptional regulator [Hoyosella altamirensis]
MTRTRNRARPGEGARLRDDILDAAEALLEESGTEEALTMRAVAAKTGVTTPAVYLHFADKEALLEAVCLRVWSQLGAEVRERGKTRSNPFSALAEQGRTFAQFALAHPIQYRVLMMRPSMTPGVSEAAQACYQFHADTVTQCVESGILQGDSERLALSLWAALHGCVSLLIAQPDFPWPDTPDAIVEDAIRMAGYGTALSSRIPHSTRIPSSDLPRRLDAAADQLMNEGPPEA